MHIDRNELIADQPIKRVRDFLRRLNMGEWDAEAIAADFALPPDATAALVDELLRRRLLEPAARLRSGDAVRYRQGPEAPRLAAASLSRPMSRTKADQLVARFLDRVRAVNADDELLYIVAEARIFGSYIDPEQSVLGDVDVAVRLEPRHPWTGAEIVALSLQRARASGRRFRHGSDLLFYGEDELWRLPKARSGYLSLHTIADLRSIGVESRQIFTLQQ